MISHSTAHVDVNYEGCECWHNKGLHVDATGGQDFGEMYNLHGIAVIRGENNYFD